MIWLSCSSFYCLNMSTRYARVADKELNDKHTKILIELLRRTENKTCADCKKKGMQNQLV